MIFGLNLLPADNKKFTSLEEGADHWRSGLIVAILITLVIAGGLGVAQWLLGRRAADLRVQQAHWQSISNQVGGLDLTQATAQVNDKIGLLSGALPLVRPWSKSIKAVYDLIPAGITVDSLVVTENGGVTLTGVAATRSSFLSLQTNLQTSKLLTGVSTGDSASKRDNLPFKYSANLAPSS